MLISKSSTLFQENRRFFESARSYDIVEPLVPLLVGEKNKKMKKMKREEGDGLMLDFGALA